eukprot:3814797-Rhodomonas_salina.3
MKWPCLGCVSPWNSTAPVHGTAQYQFMEHHRISSWNSLALSASGSTRAAESARGGWFKKAVFGRLKRSFRAVCTCPGVALVG